MWRNNSYNESEDTKIPVNEEFKPVVSYSRNKAFDLRSKTTVTSFIILSSLLTLKSLILKHPLALTYVKRFLKINGRISELYGMY